MINFIRDGVLIDESGWHASSPRKDRIEVFFQDQVRVVLTEEFLRLALDLIEWDRSRYAKREVAPADCIYDAVVLGSDFIG